MPTTLINTIKQQPASLLDDPSGCGGSCSTPPPGAARLELNASPVRVNGVLIAEAEIARELQHHDGASVEEARASAAQALVIRHLLLARAQDLSLSPAPEQDQLGRWESDEEALIRQVLDIDASPRAPTEDECRRVYDAQAATLPQPYEIAAPIIRDRLMARAWMTASTNYVAHLVRCATIEGLNIV